MADDDAAKQAEQDRIWREAQKDIVRHDKEFAKQQKKGGKR